jgi:RNA polymerase sigma factor (sigma-70 family)
VNSVSPEYEQTRWFTEEIQPHEAMLRSWLRRRFPSVPDTDDIIQETYVRVLQAQRKGDVRMPKAFLFATAGNLVRNHIRHLRHECPDSIAETSVSTVLDESAPIPEVLARAEEVELLTQAIKSLPDRCRQVFTLRRIYGLSQKEIASQLGIAEHTVEAQCTIAFRKCLKFCRRRDESGYELLAP